MCLVDALSCDLRTQSITYFGVSNLVSQNHFPSMESMAANVSSGFKQKYKGSLKD